MEENQQRKQQLQLDPVGAVEDCGTYTSGWSWFQYRRIGCYSSIVTHCLSGALRDTGSFTFTVSHVQIEWSCTARGFLAQRCRWPHLEVSHKSWKGQSWVPICICWCDHERSALDQDEITVFLYFCVSFCLLKESVQYFVLFKSVSLKYKWFQEKCLT